MEVMVIFLHPTGTDVFVLEIGAVAPWVANQVGLTVTLIAKGKIVTIIGSCIVVIIWKPNLFGGVIVESEVCGVGGVLYVFKNGQPFPVYMGAGGIVTPGTITKVVSCNIVTVSLIITDDVRASLAEVNVVKVDILDVASTGVVFQDTKSNFIN
jgi:hypothetical protein